MCEKCVIIVLGDTMNKDDIKRKKEEKVMEALLYTFLDDPNTDNIITLFYNIMDSHVAIPGNFNVSEKDLDSFMNSKKGDIVESNEEIGFNPEWLQNPETEKVYFPIFTSSEMAPKEFSDKVSWLVADIDMCIELVDKHKECSGLVLNPFTASIEIEDDLYKLFKDIFKDVRNHNLKDNKEKRDVYVSVVYDDDIVATTIKEPTFYYRTNLPVKLDDKVLVDRLGKQVVGIVTRIGYYEDDEVPYPKDKTKEVIRIIREKKEKNPVCPNCGKKLAKIEYGLAGEEPKNDDVVLGGCVVFDDSPTYHCKNCNKDFLENLKEETADKK